MKALQPFGRTTRTTISFLLAFQLGIGIYVPSASAVGQSNTPTSDDRENAPNGIGLDPRMAKLFQEIFGSDLTHLPKGSNIGLIIGQERWIWNEEGTEVIKKVQLDRTDVSMPEQNFYDPNSQLSLQYDAAQKQLLIHRIVPKGKTGSKIADSFVYNDVTLTSPPHIDANFISFATTEGVRMIPLNLLKKRGLTVLFPLS